MGESAPKDWTIGPAKWAAVVVLGGASLTGIVWSIARGPGRVPPALVVATDADAAPRGRGAESGSSMLRSSEQIAGKPSSATVRAAKIDLNGASQAQLETLPGVGPELAKRIVEFRRTRGSFKNIEQLDGVKGIGPKLMEKIRPLVTVASSETP